METGTGFVGGGIYIGTACADASVTEPTSQSVDINNWTIAGNAGRNTGATRDNKVTGTAEGFSNVPCG